MYKAVLLAASMRALAGTNSPVTVTETVTTTVANYTATVTTTARNTTETATLISPL